MHLRGGETLEADRLLVAAGRRANVHDFGFEQLGLTISKRGIEVDDRMRAAEGVWAAGDVTGIAMFTHVGKYQARAAAADAAGRPAHVDYSAIPAVTFTDPQVGLGGRHVGQGHAVGERTSVARLSTYERPKRPMLLKVFADPERRVLVGAVAVGPEAGEWLGQLTLAIRAQVPIDVVADTIQPYPTFSEMVHFAVDVDQRIAIRKAAVCDSPGASVLQTGSGLERVRRGRHRLEADQLTARRRIDLGIAVALQECDGDGVTAIRDAERDAVFHRSEGVVEAAVAQRAAFNVAGMAGARGQQARVELELRHGRHGDIPF